MRLLCLTLSLLIGGCAHAPGRQETQQFTASLQGGVDAHYLFDGEVSPYTVDAAIEAVNKANAEGASRIVIEWNTPGGDVFAGMRLAKVLENSQVPTVCVVDGMSASMGFYLLQSCQTRIMTHRSLLMAHGPAAGAAGKTSDVGDMAALLARLQHAMVRHMCKRMNVTPEEFEAQIDRRDWWMTDDEALSYGAVDRLVDLPSDV